MTTKGMSSNTILLLLTLLISQSFGYYDVHEDRKHLVERRRKQVFTQADACVSELGTSLGVSFLDCVLEKLEALERDYDNNGGEESCARDGEVDGDCAVMEDPFPVPSYTRSPLTIKHDFNDPADHPGMLMDFIRNYTCARDVDGGSPVLDKREWVYDEAEVGAALLEKICQENMKSEGSAQWNKARGFLPAGNDVGKAAEMDVESAKVHCDKLPMCEGFTFQMTADGNNKPMIFFKSRASRSGVVASDEWKTYIRFKGSGYCESNSAQQQEQISTEPPRTYTIEILREEPLVAVIPNFASQEDCDMLIEAGGTDEVMGRAHESGGGPSSYRRSYSTNIDVDYESPTDPITRFANRMFAFVRDITGYSLYGPGQEPINAVLYKDAGDEYRPHCDGPCNGQRNQYGARVATSILYCQTSDGGGQTSFTRSGMMIMPRPRDLLLFSYKHHNDTWDNGFTEHSGCPITGGRKWIATQWYREGVNYDVPWNMAENV
mmetsp:Transcript_6015/g.8864  ORF Transcript_6015/g.8864 Transcript_6015/m.8864 type:complete len:492 (+) Transcript_6015:59-1534(+)